MADGSVEIRFTGSVDSSLAASASEAKATVSGFGDAATVSASKMAAALQAVGGDLKKITPDMLGLAAAAKGVAIGQEALAAATATSTAATTAETVATEANTAAHINSRAVTESLVLVHEALSGRYSRMAGSSMILTQALAGQARVAGLVAAATSGVGIATLGTVAVLGAAVVATIQYEESQKKLMATAIGLGAVSGLTAQQLEQAGQAGAHWASQSIKQTTEAAEAFAAAGVKSQADIEALSGSVETYAQLTGVKFAKAQETLAEAMKDPVKGAQELHQQLGILDGDQLNQIQRLSDLGEKDKAVAILIKAYTDRVNDAHTAGVGFASGFGMIVNGLSNMWGWLGRVNERLNEYNILLNQGGAAGFEAAKAQQAAAQATERRVQAQAHLNDLSARGAAAYADTPEGRAQRERDSLAGRLADAQKALEADIRLHGANSDAVQRDRQAIQDYGHAINTYLTPVEKKLRADQLDVQIAAAKHSHNQQLVRDLTEQKALLQEAGKIESDADARALARGAGDVAGARVHQPKGRTKKGPDIVSEWAEQLHAAEIQSDNFFADQTEAELKFWQGKVGLVKQGSKDWLEVQSHIYEAQKTLAHRSYDEHLAEINDQLEADRDNWEEEKKDWKKKLQYIADNYKEESTEYKNAHREYEAAERQHQDKLLQIQLQGEQKALSALRAHFQAQLQLRRDEANTAEAIIKSQADGQVLGEVSAAVKIAQMHRRLAADEIASAEALSQAEIAAGQRRLAAMTAANKAGTDEFRAEQDAQAEAARAAQDRIAQLQAKSAAQQIQDILAVSRAYHSYIDGLVSSTTSAVTGILARTQTLKQGLSSVFNSLLSTVDQVLSKMLANWITTHVLMTSAQRAQLAAQQAQHAAAEAAKTTATTAGTEARVVASTTAAETTATVATASNVKEIGSDAATGAAGAYKAIAQIPYVGPFLAPAAAAAAFAAISKFSGLASFAVGVNEVPNDMVAQVHEGERIIPKADNRRLMEMLQIGVTAASNKAPANVAGPGPAPVFNLHFNGPTDKASIERWFMDNNSGIAKAMNHAYRNGFRPGRGR